MGDVDGYVILGTKVDKKGFEKGIKEIEAEEEVIENVDIDIGMASLGKVTVAIGVIATIAVGLISAFKQIKEQNGEIWSKMNAIGTSVKNLGVALFNAWGKLFIPILEYVVNLIYKIMAMINYFTKAFFNLDLFAKDFSDSMEDASGSAKGIKKQLAGFDEMNVLSDTSGGGVAELPSQLADLTKQQLEAELSAQKLIEAIKNVYSTNRDEAKKLLTESDTTWGLLKYGAFEVIQGIMKQINGLFTFGSGVLDLIVGIATGDAEKIKAGFGKMKDGIYEYIDGTEEKWSGFSDILKGLIDGAIKYISGKVKEGIDWAVRYIGEKLGISEKDFEKLKNTILIIIGIITGNFALVGTVIGNIIGENFKNIVNTAINWITNRINTFIRNINKAIDVINMIPGVGIGKLGEISLPRLAKGGILSAPGRGINYGGANIAENGAEAVLPLTDSQQMQLLGEAIGKYITINANITNTMNGRVISRELQKVTSSNQFATNS